MSETYSLSSSVQVIALREAVGVPETVHVFANDLLALTALRSSRQEAQALPVRLTAFDV